jgi:hypothetical protein
MPYAVPHFAASPRGRLRGLDDGGGGHCSAAACRNVPPPSPPRIPPSPLPPLSSHPLPTPTLHPHHYSVGAAAMSQPDLDGPGRAVPVRAGPGRNFCYSSQRRLSCIAKRRRRWASTAALPPVQSLAVPCAEERNQRGRRRARAPLRETD